MYKLRIGSKIFVAMVIILALIYVSTWPGYALSVNSTQSKSITHGDYSILEYKFPWPPYHLKAPWQSGMAQGQALQVLIKAHQVTGDKKYLNAAKMLLNSFSIEAKNGGVTYKTPSDGWWYEEYVSNSSKESRVLNGMMFTVLGIYNYYNYTHDPAANYFFDQGILSLKKNLQQYDYKGGYSRYDISGNLSPVYYHKAVINLTEQLYQITNDPIFKIYHDRWENYIVPQAVLQVKKPIPPHLVFDNLNVPLLDYGSIQGTYIGLVRNPVTIIHKALEFYNDYRINGDDKSKHSFLNNVDWLVKNATMHSSKKG